MATSERFHLRNGWPVRAHSPRSCGRSSLRFRWVWHSNEPWIRRTLGRVRLSTAIRDGLRVWKLSSKHMLPLARANGRQVRRGGSRALFEQLYRREHSHVRRYLLNSVRGDVERADDLTGDVFREVWRTYALPLALMGDADAQRLLTTAAKHRLIDLWYMDSKLVFVAGNDDTHLPLDTGSDTAAFDRVLDAGLVA